MNHIIYPYKPLLKSYMTNGYEKMFSEIQVFTNKYDKYILNQEVACWDWGYPPEDIQHKERFLAYENRPLTMNQYRDLFLSHVNVENFQRNKEILDKLYEDAKKIHQVLSKLDELGIQYALDITGGAVRDFILGKPIKDIDIMLSIESQSSNDSIINNVMNISTLKKFFSREEIMHFIDNCPEEISIHGEPVNELILKKQQLVMMCLQNLMTEKYLPSQKTKIATDYVDFLSKQGVLGVFKLNQEKMELNFPVDILVTEKNKADFINHFDLDICKASFSLKNDHYKTSFPKDSLELISRFSSQLCFWQDVNNNVMTMSIDNVGDDVVHNTISKHYKRLLEKYPDYELKFYSRVRDKDKKEEIQERINKLQYYYLQEILEKRNKASTMKL